MAVKGTTLSVMNMFVKKNQSTAVINAELLFQGMVIEHNLPLALNDHYSKLVSRMFPDSEIARQYACGRTKATHIAYSVASHSVDGLKKAPYSLATDGGSDEEDKFFPVLITHVDEETGLITTSFLDMPVVNEATGENIASALKASLKQGGLDVEQCVAFSSDNASVMTGQHRGVMSYLRKGNKDIHLVGCPCHLSALAAKTGGKALRRFDVEDFIIDLYYQFDKRWAKLLLNTVGNRKLSCS